MFSVEVEETQGSIKSQVRAVEVRTEHHDWKSRKEPPALGDLIALTAKMSGCDMRIGSCLRKQKMLAEMITFIEEQSAKGQFDEGDNSEDQAIMSRDVPEILKPLKRRATAQQIDTEFIQHRVRTQLDAVSPSKGPVSYYRGLLKIAVDHVKHSQRSEEEYSRVREHYNNSAQASSCFMRFSLKLEWGVPKPDSVGRLNDLMNLPVLTWIYAVQRFVTCTTV